MKKAIDFYYEAKKDNSHYQMAKILGVSQQAISEWRKGGAIKPYYAALCAQIAGLDTKEAMAIAAAEAEREPERREFMMSAIAGKQLLEKISANFEALASWLNPRRSLILAR